ncbi:MAG: hypothetical protein PVH12_08245 [Candidatus Bathyarchaeota archaeon]|jgi:hypothetical protein
MPPEAEGLKRLVDFKKKLQTRIEALESELGEQRSILEVVDSILLEKSFKRAKITGKSKEVEVHKEEEEDKITIATLSQESEESSQLMTGTGEVLAYFHMGEDTLRIVVAEDKRLDVDTPPFKQFLVERVLEKMEEKDTELAEKGKLDPEKIFSFDIVKDGNVLQELVIKNFDDKRLKELKSSARWTLEKMYEKT